MHRFEGGQHFVTNFNPFLITVGFVALIVGIVSPETLGNSRFLFGIAMALLS